MTVGFDADQDCSAVAARAYAAGVRFCCRYLKNLTAREVAALHAAGLAVVLIFETIARRALDGQVAGAADGAAAKRQALALGAPRGAAVYATADWDVSAAEEPLVISYAAAFAAALAPELRFGFYANGAVCQTLLSSGVTSLTWLAGGGAMRGTTDFKASGRATLLQDVGDRRDLNLPIDIDTDVAPFADYGQWPPGEIPVQPPVDDSIIAAVRALQTALAAGGYYRGAIDGIWGQHSADAMNAWKRR